MASACATPNGRSLTTSASVRPGPSLKTKEKLTAEGTWEQCRGGLRELYESLNRASDGGVHLESEYLRTIARKG